MHQVLLRKFERESKAMKRLSMENEELIWRLSQSDIGPSCLQDKLPTGDNCGSSLMSRSFDGHHQSVPLKIPTNSSSQDVMSQMSKSYDGSSTFPVLVAATMTEPPSSKATVPQMPRMKSKRSGHSKWWMKKTVAKQCEAQLWKILGNNRSLSENCFRGRCLILWISKLNYTLFLLITL